MLSGQDRSPTRKLAVVATCRRFDMESVCAEFAPGYPVQMISAARLRTGVNGSAAAILEVPGDEASAVTARLRQGLRGVTPVRPVLVGCAVNDDHDEDALLRAAGAALVSGHGVAHDLTVQQDRQARASATTGLRGRLGAVYAAASVRNKRFILIALTMGAGLLGPFLTYSVLWTFLGLDLAPILFWVVFAMLVLTAGSIAAEMLHAIAPPDLPAVEDERVRASDPVRTGNWPRISVVIAAYLPNEVEVLPASVQSLLALDYPGQFEILVAANGDGERALEGLRAIRKLVSQDERLRLVLAPGSRSKAENINAALEVASGEIVGILDADHQLASDVLTRAARWIAGGYADVVQGHNVVRNGAQSRLARTVAVEFEGIYAVAHPGRARLHGFGIFGGSNGFWRADLLDRLRMRPWMLTEDIDVSTRALLAGAVICSDRWMVSRELAPTTMAGFWSQRMRWAQGWHQVSRRYLRPCMRATNLTVRQKLGLVTMFWLREIYPWVALQMFPLLSYQLFIRHAQHVHWLLPPFVLATICVTSMGPLQAFAAWRFAAPEMRARHRWFAEYLYLTGALFGELKAVINRGAHLRQWLGDEAWAVTPRNAEPSLDAAAGPADPGLALPGTGVEFAEAIRDSDADLPGVPAVALPLVFLSDGRGRARAVSLTRMLRGPLEAGAAPYASSAELFRILAALLIVAYHIRQNMAVKSAFSPAQGLHLGDDYPYQNIHWFEMFMTNLDIFVDFFFVVSAFLLALPWMRALLNGTALPSVRAFALGRLLRVVPLYYALVLFIWTMRNHGYPGEWRDLLEHLTFTQWLDSHRIFYTIGPAWSLADEMWLYPLVPLVAFAVVKLTRRLRSPATRAVVVLIPLLALSAGSIAYKYWVDYVLHVPGDHWAWRFGVPAKVDVFCFGVILALVVTLVGDRRMPAIAGVFLRIGAFAGLVWFLSHRVADIGMWATYAHTVGGVASALLVAAIVLSKPGRLSRRLGSPRLASIGALTFALYICHESILDPLTSAGVLGRAPRDLVVNWIIGVVVAIVLAFVLHHLIEQPAMRLRQLWDTRGRRQLEHYDEADRLPAHVGELVPVRSAPRVHAPA